MGKRLTEAEKQEKQVKKIIQRILSLEKVYEPLLVERACMKYKNSKADYRKASKEKEELEKRLAEAKRRLSK